LKDVDWEVGIPSALGDLLRRLPDGLRLLCIQQAQLLVHLRRRALNQSQRTDKHAREANAADGEVLHRALRLRAVQRVGGHLHLAQRIAFRSELAHTLLLLAQTVRSALLGNPESELSRCSSRRRHAER